MYNNYYSPNMPQYRPSAGLKGRPVTSIDEARASAIDFDGTIFYFPDMGNERIYTKRIAMDGTAIFEMYVKQEVPIQESTVEYVSKTEFDQVIAQLRSLIPAQEMKF